MYVKIITSSGFKSTLLTDFVQGQLRVPFRFWPMLEISRKYTYLPEVVVSSAGSSTTRAARHQMEKNRSRIYDLGVVPTEVNSSLGKQECMRNRYTGAKIRMRFLFTECQPISARYHIDRLPQQPVSSKRNHHVANKVRKVGCLMFTVGNVGVKQYMHSFHCYHCLIEISFYDYTCRNYFRFFVK